MDEAVVREMPDIASTKVGALVRLTPRDSLNSERLIEAFQNAVETNIEARHVKINLDLAAVQLINSLGLEAMLDAQDRLLRRGGWLKYSNANSLITEVFGVCGVTGYIKSFDPVSRLDGLGSSGPVDPSRRRLGDILVDMDLITEDQVVEASALQSQTGMRIGHIVVDKGWVSEQELLNALSRQLSIPVVMLRPGTYDPAVAGKLDRQVAKRLGVFPIFCVRGVLYVATATPQAVPSLTEIEERTGCSAKPVLAKRDDILRLTEQNSNSDDYTEDLISDVDDDFEHIENRLPEDYSTIDDVAAGSPVINLVNSIIQRSVRDGASDIHIEPSKKRSRIRYRIDGVLYEYKTLRMELHPSLVSRLKVMANLDIAERRMPQDGRIQVQTQGRSVDLRFSSLPGMYGEKVVLRILDKRNAILDVEKLGMAKPNLNCFKGLLKRSHGLVLVTGPTGSGKTTSLYAALNYLNSVEKNIVTIEDPVEYQLDVVNQNQVSPAIGLGFAKILKHVLRQDPDVIMVGEIRERETAKIAVEAALTGHLVLSTLHTNDSIGAVTRMIDMGVEPYLLSSALIGVVAQRLVRKICPSCQITTLAPPQVIERYGWDAGGRVQLARGEGCKECYDSGYRGRVSIHEVLDTDEQLQQLVLSGPSRDQLSNYMAQRGIRELFDDGMDRVLDLKTTIEEVNRVVSF
ncbi:MAG: ATPase, T2SS/T4P/T4SS family [Gammaproteobacteria bacterium]